MATRVLSLDPGEKVGWARAEVDFIKPGAFLLTEVVHGINSAWPFLDVLAENIDHYDVIVMEKWRLFAGFEKTFIGSEFPSVQFIGAVKMLARTDCIKVVMQGADVQKIGIARMKADKHPLYEIATQPVAHDDGHDQSALAHLYYYCWRESTR